MKIKLLFLLSCISASVYAMQRSEEELRQVVNAYIEHVVFRTEQGYIDAAHELHKNKQRKITSHICDNEGCRRTFGASGTLAYHKRRCRFMPKQPMRERFSFTCPDCNNFTTMSLRAFKKHKDACGVVAPMHIAMSAPGAVPAWLQQLLSPAPETEIS